jgi:hypothetical protein
MSNVQQFIDLVGQGQNAQAQEALNDILSAKAFDALEAYKQQVGANLFATEESVQVDEEAEQLDELSKDTLKSYISKADDSKSKHMDAGITAKRAATNVGAMKDINVGNPEHSAAMRKAATDYHGSLSKDAEYHDAKWKQRMSGIKTANKKLAK